MTECHQPEAKTDYANGCLLELDELRELVSQCARNNSVDDLQQLLSLNRAMPGFSLNLPSYSKSFFGWTPLHLAAFFGHSEACRFLLEHGADVDAPADNGDTPLHKASYTGRSSVVRILLDAGCDVRLTNYANQTPSDLAKTPEVADMIAAAEIHAGKQLEQRLLAAAQAGDCGTADQLLGLTCPPDLHCTDRYGNTPLHLAARSNRSQLAVQLLERGADPSKRNLAGCCPADLAVSSAMRQLLASVPSLPSLLHRDPPAPRSGLMQKKAAFLLLGWRTIHVELDNAELRYYRASKSGGQYRATQSLAFQRALNGSVVTSTDVQADCLVVCFSNGARHTLRCMPEDDSPVARQLWLTAIRRHIEFGDRRLATDIEAAGSASDSSGGGGGLEDGGGFVPIRSMAESVRAAEAHQQILVDQVAAVESLLRLIEQPQSPTDASRCLAAVQPKLRALSKSSAEVAGALSSCLAQITQQEELRRSRLHQLTVKCRFLEDSLSALAERGDHSVEESVLRAFTQSERILPGAASASEHYEDETFADCLSSNDGDCASARAASAAASPVDFYSPSPSPPASPPAS
ncbi:hypothetical protein BOX15_Mlig028154g1 [Macrostomum lignano]|uniref:PH domain-containing protein n=1 Tax=Macrostomum lignano TaxID=282301 RepID=A0A267F694_9PLAT|nr:hypothetical protein BOX15_Mlig028154g1 [Macrostomum lignano]